MAAEPVAGSSGTPRPGTNTRVWATRLDASQENTLTWVMPAALAAAASPALCATASGTTGRNGNSRPTLANPGAGPAKSSAVNPTAASRLVGSKGSPTVGVPPVNVARPSPYTVMGSSPAPHSCTRVPAPPPRWRDTVTAAPTLG